MDFDEMEDDSNNCDQGTSDVNVKDCKNESKPSTRRVISRRNTRKKRSQVNNPFQISVRNTDWSAPERAALYLGLKKYGMLDIKALSELVKTKSEEEIQKFIKVSWKTTRAMLNSVAKKKQQESTEAPIERWLQEVEMATPNCHAFNSAYCKILPKVFLCLSKYGNHPDPSECGGVDFREAYEYLFYMLSGLPGKTLSPATAKFVMSSLPQLGVEIRKPEHHPAKNFLYHFESFTTRSANSKNLISGKNYGRKKTAQTPASTPLEAMQKLLQLPGFNPLQVPLNVLKRSESLDA